MLLAGAVSPGLFVTPAAAQEAQYSIQIPATTLKQALVLLSGQTGISIGKDGALPNIRTPAVRGLMSAHAALRLLLAKSGFRAQQVAPGIFRLEPAPAEAPAQSRRTAKPPNPAPPEEESIAPPPPDIIVTGTKRSQALFQAPLSISVFSPDDEPSTGLASAAIVASRIDGLTLTGLGPGRQRHFIRGVADSPFNGPSQSTVSVMLDHARVTYDAPDPDLRLVDVERVELLKGPQGPLYGTGALGGIYHIVQKSPVLDAFSGHVAITGNAQSGGGAGASGELVANLPVLTDRLAIRAVAYAEAQPGWIDNQPGQRNANDSRVLGGRLSARLQLAPGWTLDTSGMVQLLDADDTQYVSGQRGTRTRQNVLPEPFSSDFGAVQASLNGTWGSRTLLATIAYVHQKLVSIHDASSAAASFGETAPLLFADRRSYHIINPEIRMGSAQGATWGWLVGLSYLQASSVTDGLLQRGGVDLIHTDALDRKVRETAIFAELSVPLAEHVKLTGGVRAFQARARDAISEGPVTSIQSLTEAGISPSLAVSWTPRPDLHVWLRYASALRPAGLTLSNPGDDNEYESDQLYSIELGTRYRIGGDFSLESSLFYTHWTHIQADYVLNSGLTATRNAGYGRIIGVDSAIKWKPDAHWQLRLGVIVQHPEIYKPEGNEILPPDADLPVVPDVALRGSIARSFTLGSWSGLVEARSNFIGLSRVTNDMDQDTQMGGFATTSLSAAASRGAWSVGLTMSNLLNNKGNRFSYGNPFSFRNQRQYTPAAPRNVSLTISRRW